MLLMIMKSIIFLTYQPMNTVSGSELEATYDAVRTIERDGVNLVYILQRMHGGSLEYNQILERLSGHPPSLLSLKHAVTSHGLQAKILGDVHPSTLADRVPFLTMMDSLGGDSGTFILVYAVTGEHVDTIHGGAATLRRYSMREFRHGWCGYVLVLASRAGKYRIMDALWIAGGIGVIFFLSVFGRNRRAIS